MYTDTKIQIIDDPEQSDLDRMRGKVINVAQSGQSVTIMEQEASFDADAVNAVPQSAYEEKKIISAGKLGEMSEQKFETLISSIEIIDEN